MNPAASRPRWAAGLSLAVHAAVIAVVMSWDRPPVAGGPSTLPLIELLPGQPATRATPQAAHPEPTVEAAPRVPARVSASDLPVIRGADPQEAQAPVRPERPRISQAPETTRPEPVTPPPEYPPASPATAPTLAESLPTPAGTAARSEVSSADAAETGERSAAAAGSAAPSDAMLEYFTMVATRLERNKRYPADARRRHQQGVVTLRFSVDRSGRVLDWWIDRSAGVTSLDEEVGRMVDRTAPFPRFPASLPQDTLEFSVSIEFALR